ncbi:MAG: C25 family cysteine peptidase [Ardenticatenaceae bacterium]|nr:C25 family cysteine peptidase [Ardenticatenaceae bacterium]
MYATERITYTITLSWLGEEEALIQVRDHIPQGTSLVPGSLSWGPYIPRCQYDPGFRDVTCTGKFPSTDVELTTFVSFAVTTDCEIGTWSTPGFLNRAVVYIGDYEFFPQTLTGEKMPFQLRPSTSGYKRNLLPRRHNVLLYTVPKGDEPEALLRDCALDFYVVANGDKNQPLKMQNDGQGPDLHAGDLHHSLWFTPTDDIVEMLDLYVVEAGQPFAKAVHADTMMLEPRLPRLVVLIDFRALFNEFHEVSQKYPSGQRDPQIKDQNQNRILDYYDLVERIRQYADAHFGVVVDVRRNAYYDPAVDYYADTATRSLMGQEIDALVSALPRSVKSIAIVGTDAVVPYLRVPVSPGAANETRFPTQEVGNTRNPTLADIADASMSEKGRWMSDAQYGTFDLFRTLPDVLRLDMAVGRVFRDFPLDLIALIDRQEQPLYLHKDFSRAWAMETKNDYVDFEELVEEFVLPALRGHYGPGSTTRLNWRPGRMPGYPGFAYGAYWLSGNRLLRPDDEYWQPEDIKDRVRTDSDLLIFIGHGTEKGVSDGEGESFIGRGDLAAGVVAGPAISHFGLVISSGCHTGLLPAFRSAPTWRNNWLSNAVLDANAALIAATSYDVSVSFLGDQLDVYHDQMRRLILERLFRDRYPTIGDVLVAANRSYRLRRTGGDDNDLRTLYSVHLIGLPTQPVDRGYGNRPGQASATGSPAETPRWDASPQAASAGQATHTITRSVAISHFEVLTDAQGRVGFTLPHNGGLDGESGAPGLPLVQHSYPLPLAATEVTVTLTLTQARDYGAAVEMIPTVLVEKSWGPQTTIVTLTTPYPQAILTSRVYTDADGLRLDVRLTPLQYHPQTRRVTLYDRLDYQVTYSAPATYTVQDITANNGAPANVNQASLPISVTLTAAQPFSGTLDWEILDMAGRMLDGGAEAVTLDAGTSQVGLTGDTLGWKPGLKQVLVSLSTGRSVTETGVLVAGGQALFAVQGNSLAVEAGKPVYGPGDAAATFTATVRDATGAQLSGLAGNFTQQLDDNPLALTWREGGSYTATLDLAGIVTGQHTLTVTLPAGGKAARSFIIDRDPPTSTLWSPTIVSTPTFTVTISGGDDLSGVDVYHVQYRAGESGAWTDWLTRTTGYDYSHTGLNELTLTFGPTSPVPVASGATYSFRVQAVDRAGNEEAEHSQADTATSISAACSTLTTAFVTAEPAGSLDLAAQVSNTAGAQVPAGLPVAFYANSSLIGTATTTQALAAAASEVVTVTWPGETPGDHIITIVPNDDGTGTGPVALCSPPAPVQQLVSILDVPLAESWNLISSYVHPFTPDITVVQRPISGTYAVIQSFDGGALSYYPDLPAEVNTLKEMKAEYGYWIKRVNSEQPALATLRVVGETFAADRPLALAAGWNLVSYLPRQPLPVTTALQSIDGHYSAVLGFAGGALSYYPDLDPSFNTLTAMEPLHGYWLKLNQAGTLHYPVTSHQLSVNSSPSPVISDPSAQTTDHWSPVTDHSPVTPTPTWVNFYGLAHLPDGTPLAIATTVLAVDPDGVTCGATAVTTEGQYGLLACYGDDPDTPEDEGARPGDTIRLVVDGQVLGTGMWTAHGERQWAPLGAVELHRLWLPLLRRGDG